MNTLNLDLPPEIPVEEATLLLATKLWEKGRLSLGQAARLAGFSKRTFIELLGNQGVTLFSHDPDELEREIAL